jgi:hypothetical protein
MWAGVRDTEIATELTAADAPLRETLRELAERAIVRTGAASDNTSAAALRWIGEK